MRLFSWIKNLLDKLFGRNKEPLEIARGKGGKVLLVGINKYAVAPLAGCVNDVKDVRDMLVQEYGIDRKHIRVLTDRAATADAIRKSLQWLIDVKPGEMCYFHYSGHGVQVPFGELEVDGLSEAICPVDFDWSRQHTIIDDDFRKIFSGMPARARLYWFSDSCHSGDLTRSMDESARMMPIPDHMVSVIESLRQKSGARSLDAGALEDNLNMTYASGCQSNQTSADTIINGRPCGAFTHHFIRALKKAPKDLPLKKVVANTINMLKHNRYTQIPTVEGPRIIFPFLH